MTDTIDVAALVERLRAADRPHLSDLAVSVHEHLCREAATALQSQAAALAEARREVAQGIGNAKHTIMREEWVADFLNRRTEVENWLRAPAQTQRKGRPVPPSPTPEEMEQWANRLGVPTEVAAYSAQPTTAEASLATMREALEELANLMDAVVEGEYQPDSFTTQPARRALGGSNAE